MNSNKLLAVFLVLAITVPLHANAKIMLSFDMLKATWFQAIELIKTNRAAQIVTGLAAGTTLLSSVLGYKVWQLNKEKTQLEKNEKNIYTQVIPAVADALTINSDKRVADILGAPPFVNLSSSTQQYCSNLIVTCRHNLFWLGRMGNTYIKEKRYTYNYSEDKDLSNYWSEVKKHATEKQWNEQLLEASRVTNQSNFDFVKMLQEKIDTINNNN